MGWAGILEDMSEISTVEKVDNKFLELLTEEGKNNKDSHVWYSLTHKIAEEPTLNLN